EYRDMNLTRPITPREVLVAHQIAEAGRLVLSKIDVASESELEAAQALLRDLNPSAEIIRCSARTGAGIDALVDLVTSGEAVTIPASVEIDYETYAAAEAEMGWYNGRAELLASSAFDPEALAFDLAMQLGERLGAQLIHGKVLVTTETGSIKVSVVGGVLQADVTREGSDAVERAALTVNLRATLEPTELATIARELIHAAVGPDVRVGAYDHRSLIPGAPVPEYRIT
ncbi:MAG: hypothetical protein ACOC7V_14310, partial [Spirochaetota bacterium]